MAPFNAELHLRLLGERGLLGGGARQRGYDAGLLEAARALLGLGAIDTAVAAEIVEGYALATGMRNGGGVRAMHRPSSPQTPTTPEARRTVVCHATLQRPTEEILVRSVTLTPSETRLNVLIQMLGDTRQGGRRRPGRGPMMAAASYPIADDRGGKGTTQFSGGGGDREWRGRLTSSQPLSVDTAWIELDGTRIELVDRSSSSVVTIEPLKADDPALRYLWHWLATADRHGPQQALEPVLETLVVCGGLRADDALLAAVRQAAETRRNWMGQPQSRQALSVVDGVPTEWRSFLEPKPNRRPARGTVALAAVTPPFDGMTVTADELIADGQGWQVEVDLTPGISHGPFGGSIDEPRIAWWAVDDRGQHYLGQMGSYSAGPDGATGTLEFTPALDGTSKTLVLLPTGPTERARIEFPLDWSEP